LIYCFSLWMIYRTNSHLIRYSVLLNNNREVFNWLRMSTGWLWFIFTWGYIPPFFLLDIYLEHTQHGINIVNRPMDIPDHAKRVSQHWMKVLHSCLPMVSVKMGLQYLDLVVKDIPYRNGSGNVKIWMKSLSFR